MISRTFFRASLVALGVAAALGNHSVWAQDAGTAPQGEKPVTESEELNVITVTGSRTITDVLKSPTPITSVDIATVAATTPSDTADALNKLPQFLAGGATGGRTPRNQGNGANNNGGNTLSLRNFGASRTLVLLDGHRVAPNNQDGSVNIDVLPQMLVKNVDIVTGGASAVYGPMPSPAWSITCSTRISRVCRSRAISAAPSTTMETSTSLAPPGAPHCSAIAAISRFRPACASRMRS